MDVGARAPSTLGRLVRAGFFDPPRAHERTRDRDLVAVFGEITGTHPLLDMVGLSPDPDLALLTLVRLCAVLRETNNQELIGALQELIAPPDARAPAPSPDGLKRLAAARLFMILGHSSALGDDLVRKPHLLPGLLAAPPTLSLDTGAMRATLLARVGATLQGPVQVAATDTAQTVAALRAGYRELLLQIAAYDLSTPDPTAILDEVARALADLAGAALEAALAIARAKQPDGGAGVEIAVIGMGKCGGQELNYVSDVDVIYVVEPKPGYDQEYAFRVGTQLARDIALVCASSGPEPALWPVDAGLRPEGKQGPLVRTVESHRAYYERWAQTWEFQALLKARLIAGDSQVAQRYLDAVLPLVWTAASRPGFVEDSQAMRRRVEENVPAKEAGRQLKLGKGGLRDVEFTVQLLQLVHGRQDPNIHSSNTLEALAELARGGYVGREHAAHLANCYRFMRVLEHRLQLRNLKRTHLMPSEVGELEVLARSLGMRKHGAEGLVKQWHEAQRDVRKLHQILFYRPLLPATAQLSAQEASLAPEAATARLAAVGYRDPPGALRNIDALTAGLTRRAAIQRQLLPVMIGWFSQGADPDQGLLNFRTLSEELGSTPWYLKLLRDSGSAAKRLAFLLSTSQYVSAALNRSPESIAWLDREEDLEILSCGRLDSECDALIHRSRSPQDALTALRALRRRELARISCAQMLERANPRATAVGITTATEVAIAGALRIAQTLVMSDFANSTQPALSQSHQQVPAQMSVIAMGRLGGKEMGYGSDADVMFVYEPSPGTQEPVAQNYAHQAAVHLRTLLTQGSEEPALMIDADLRPEGRTGPLVRSLASFAQYYARWSQPWESQALLRARPIAGDRELGRQFIGLIDPLRYPTGGIDAASIKEIRRLKARMEAERLPRGADPTRHLKLGRGSLTDVEWVVQLLQLQHGYSVPALRTTETLAGLTAAKQAGLIAAKDANTLAQAWQFASKLRDAIALQTGRTTGVHTDILPTERTALGALGMVLGYPQGAASRVQEDYQRTARRARRVMEKLFYEFD